MFRTLKPTQPILTLGLAFLFVLVFATPAFAGESATASVVFAGWGDFFRGLARRDRVIQVSIVTMALALFILLKKFDQPSDR